MVAKIAKKTDTNVNSIQKPYHELKKHQIAYIIYKKEQKHYNFFRGKIVGMAYFNYFCKRKAV